MNQVASPPAADTMTPPIKALFARLLEEMDGAESAEWDATETLLDAKV